MTDDQSGLHHGIEAWLENLGKKNEGLGIPRPSSGSSFFPWMGTGIERQDFVFQD